jgi:hypothetical protein
VEVSHCGLGEECWPIRESFESSGSRCVDVAADQASRRWVFRIFAVEAGEVLAEAETHVVVEEPPDEPGEDEPSAEAAERAVITYWNLVSEGDYEAAWEMLSGEFKEREHGGSFDDYVDGYESMKLCSVRATDVKLESAGPNEATVSARVVYETGSSCQKSEYRFVLYLVDDMFGEPTLIDRLER